MKSEAWVSESRLTLISEGSRIEGKIRFEQFARVHGALIGEIHAAPGSHLVIAETGWVEGNIQADTITIDGFIRGDVVATGKVTVSGTGRVIGNIRAPRVALDFGCTFEGRCVSGISEAAAPQPA